MSNEIEIIETNGGVEVIEAQQRAEYDIQIATAKKYPRDLTRVKNNCVALVTMDKEIADSCRYALPRGGKTLSGPTVHMARIMVQQYGNVRVEARIKQITDKQVISEAVCFDLETNYACKVEVRRSIIGKQGRFNDDMVTVTGNASNAIALRNAILNVIPKGITDIVYKSAMQMITGDLSDETKLIAARKKMIDFFKDTYSIAEAQILKTMGLNSINQIKGEQIADLRGMAQSLKDGDSTVDEMFGDGKPVKEKTDLDIMREKIIAGIDFYQGTDKDEIKADCVKAQKAGKFDIDFAKLQAKKLGVEL